MRQVGYLQESSKGFPFFIITNSIRSELQTECILDKIDEYRRNWLLHLQRTPQNRIPLKIIPLQPTRKENNWETEETLERATVTLETERAK